jgi:PAS domain S-box-containing protein
MWIANGCALTGGISLRDAAGPARNSEAPAGRASSELGAAELEAAPIPAAVLALDGTIAFVNAAMLAITGDVQSDLLGRSHAALSGGAGFSGLGQALDAVRLGGTWHGEGRCVGRDGSALAHEVTAWPIHDAAGAVTHMVVMCHDLTERRQSQARLLLTDRMVSIGTLAAGVAHEINNPLAFVLTNLNYALEALAEGGTPLAEVREALLEVRQGADRVRDIVRDLKTFTRSEDGERRAVDVERVLESSIKMAWNEIRHRAQLVRSFARVPPVVAEEARLGQVFLNFILNAVQAIPEGDVKGNAITVATRLGSDGRVVIDVRDTGAGIPESVRPHLFEPFFTTKPVGVGTGLGLYICHSIVVSLGGSIEVESAPGKGSCFRVRLPAAQRSERSAAGLARAGGGARRGKVLVVDDEPMIGATLTRILSAHEVVPVHSAREALARIEAGERFDVILCDLMMPEMNGMDLHAALAKAAPEVVGRMVFLTGGIFTAAARAFVEQTSAPIVEKPFDPASLREMVAKRVGGG